MEVQEAPEGLDADYRPGSAIIGAKGFTDKVAHGLVPAPGQLGKVTEIICLMIEDTAARLWIHGNGTDRDGLADGRNERVGGQPISNGRQILAAER
ncbi:MAG: hypothetical protein V1800_11015, partial [Candidatus Latescibacterota bacterium]